MKRDEANRTFPQSLAWCILAEFLLVAHVSVSPLRAEPLIPGGDFERVSVGDPPPGWTTFTKNTTPWVTVMGVGANGSKQAVRGVRSNYDGLIALARAFDKPQQRVRIEFSFAFSPGAGRSLNVWSFDPERRDASQFNLCIQNGALRQYDGRSRSWVVVSRDIEASRDPKKPVWHRVRVIVDAKSQGVDFWLSKPGSTSLPKERTGTRSVYRTRLPLAGFALVSGKRIAPGAWYLVDDLDITNGDDIPAPHEPAPVPKPFELWTGPPIPKNVTQIPFVPGVTHRTIHKADPKGYKFLHGAAIVAHRGVLYANWANSPTNENGPHETLQGRRSRDGGKTWSDVEVIGPGFEGPERHSHGVLFVHKGEVWTICSRFGKGAGRRFPGLKGEAFVLAKDGKEWKSRGIVMTNCWPYDEPTRMANGNSITGGQDKDGLPVVAISRADDFTKWDTVAIPYDERLAPSFAETTVLASGKDVIALIRGGRGVAWVAVSKDFGRTWSEAKPSNFPMPRAKAYLGQLSTGERYLLSNLYNRDTLVVSLSKPGETTLSRMWRIRSGRSGPPHFPGKAKGKQWSYPYGYEHDGKLYVVYSVGKEDCGLSVVPLAGLRGEE